MHELYHIDPEETGIRRFERADGTDSMRTHGPHFYEEVAEMVKQYLASDPIPRSTNSCSRTSPGYARHGGVLATTFRNFPSFPQRYMERLDPSRLQRARRAAQAGDAAGSLYRGGSARASVHRVADPPPRKGQGQAA